MNDTLYKNIVYFCKVNKFKIGDVEKYVGVSQGYFSRRRTDHTTAKVALLLAQMFGCTVEELLLRDIAQDRRIVEIDRQIAALREERAALVGLEY